MSKKLSKVHTSMALRAIIASMQSDIKNFYKVDKDTQINIAKWILVSRGYTLTQDKNNANK